MKLSFIVSITLALVAALPVLSEVNLDLIYATQCSVIRSCECSSGLTVDFF